MNYQKIYNSLINYRLQNPANLTFDYTENHHIIPRSIDKSKDKDKNNIVNLSAREHFIAHALLVKIYKQLGDKDKWYRMLCAFDAMSKLYGSNFKIDARYKNHSNSKLYQIWKIELSKYIKESGCRKGINSTTYGKTVYHNPITNQIKYFNTDEIPPKCWIKGTGISTKSTLNMIWVHNQLTDEQKLIKKENLKIFLNENKNWINGMSKNSKVHIQQYNPSEGKKWITNLELKQSKRINNEENIPDRMVTWKNNQL